MPQSRHKNYEPDPAEKALAIYEESEKDFQNHWVWRELRCKPGEFFEAVKKHVASLNVPPEKWNEAYRRIRESSRVRSNERRSAYKPVNLKMIGALRV